MKKFVMASLCGAALLAVPFAALPAGALNNEIERGYVSVSYTAEKEVAPDTVEVSISVKTSDKKSMSVAVAKNKEISDKVYDYLKNSINTANGDYIKTSNYSAAPNYGYDSGKRYFDKYEVSNNIIVHTKTIDNISTMIDKALSLGATDVDSLNFSLSSKDAVCADLLTVASQKAQKRAVSVAGAVGSSVTGIRTLETACTVNRFNAVNYARNSLVKMDSAAGAEMSAAPSAPIESGVITVYSTINASFFLK